MSKLDAYRDDDGKLRGIAWPGGYTILYLMADGETLCAACANEPEASEDTDEQPDKAWQLVDGFVHWEGPDSYCAHCNKVLPSEYGDPDEEKGETP